jgi:hypothetical protein
MDLINLCLPCLMNQKRHYRPFSGPDYVDDVPHTRAFGQRIRCKGCGHETVPWRKMAENEIQMFARHSLHIPQQDHSYGLS